MLVRKDWNSFCDMFRGRFYLRSLFIGCNGLIDHVFLQYLFRR